MSGFAMVQSRAVLGLEAPSVTVEVHLANGLPSFTLVGLAEIEVKEARERVRSALQNSGLEWFFRLIQEPRRLFKRYFVTNVKFIQMVFSAKFLSR